MNEFYFVVILPNGDIYLSVNINALGILQTSKFLIIVLIPKMGPILASFVLCGQA